MNRTIISKKGEISNAFSRPRTDHAAQDAMLAEFVRGGGKITVYDAPDVRKKPTKRVEKPAKKPPKKSERKLSQHDKKLLKWVEYMRKRPVHRSLLPKLFGIGNSKCVMTNNIHKVAMVFNAKVVKRHANAAEAKLYGEGYVYFIGGDDE
ncbi:hypothetical protein B0181_09215 [Moraxella caviae]|uniref:Uncharacterized protein n=2 Tax=Moraxella caviae TaxID=34060 RepID=A0A1S9ZX20_9GAMM|nr:hypothetical protein [Moraxella caviae]OOR87998.1 hypothetical protein B0181_09215 [Moraxella caviae]STZ14021.1 Uncharacterised protein [Moraxella caviae]STZ14493.1 Uncharacterised protein [Moraxella caviae]VEW12843.1 Uncharacterised protein [Moraxella caviae]